jgi:hypothetical protein
MNTLTKQQIDELNLIPDESLRQYIVEDNSGRLAEWFYGSPGTEYYTLLTALSHCFNDTTIFDIGTFRGSSALALASNPKNKVITYDIVDGSTHSFPANVEKKIGDYKQDPLLSSRPISDNVSLIVFDCDPHNGVLEKEFVEFLTNSAYKGVVIFDDINLNDNMKQFWESVTQEKYDITDKGHWSGTGVVFF